MEIILNDYDNDNIKVEVKGYDNDLSGPEDLLFNLSKGISEIVGEMVFQIAKDATADDKKAFANGILDLSKEMVSAFYDDIKEQLDKAKKEAELYEAMLVQYEKALRNYNIDEDEIIKLAQTEEHKFAVEESEGSYLCNIIFGDRTFTLGKIPIGLSERYFDSISFEVSLAAVVLFDKAFPDDESKNPIRSQRKFNVFQDLLEDL